MELRQLKSFQTVARLMSFNRAAKTLNYAQSSVSAQIKLLEEELGVRLFNRLGKHIRLTEAGQTLLLYSQKLLDIERETVAKVSGWEEPQGSISLRIPQSLATYLLPDALRKFQIRFPKVGFDIATCAYDTLIHELKTGIIDAAFLLAESIPFSDLKSEVLRIERLVVVSGPSHPLSQKEKVASHCLAGQSILLPKHDCSYKMLFERILSEEKVEPATFMELNSVETIKQCVIQGIGVAMLPLMAIQQEIDRHQLRILPWPEDPLETAVLMIWHKAKWLSPALLNFMDIVRQVMKCRDAEHLAGAQQ